MNLVKIGAYLKAVREKKDISQDEVYQKTRIQVSVIESIEEGLQTLSPVFLKGFVKVYAKFLEVDISEYLVEEPVEPPQEPTLKKDKFYLSRWIEKPSFKKNWQRKMGFLFVFVFFLFLVALVSNKFFFNSNTDISSQIRHALVPLEGLERKSAVPDTQIKELDSLTEQKLLNSSSTQAIDPTDSKVAVGSETPKKSLLLDKIEKLYFQQEILIQSSKSLKIYFKVDDLNLETKNLPSQEWYNINALDKIYLRFDQAEYVKIFYNGKRVIFKGQFFEKVFTSDTM